MIIKKELFVLFILSIKFTSSFLTFAVCWFRNLQCVLNLDLIQGSGYQTRAASMLDLNFDSSVEGYSFVVCLFVKTYQFIAGGKMQKATHYDAIRIKKITQDIFMANGLSEYDADTIAEGLILSDLRGVYSHGVVRVPMYCERLRHELVNRKPNIFVQQTSSASRLIDGDNGMGFVVGRKAMKEAIELAKTTGISLVGVKNSGHFGMSAFYLLQALEADMISFVYTNSSPAMPVWGGRTKFLGASPFAAAAPGGKYGPYVLDMACTVTARGKLKYAAQRGESIALGLALDSDGKPTTDGNKAFHGVILPFGGVKGAALAMLMEILSGVFTGAAFAGDVRNPHTDLSGPQNVGHFFMAIKPDLFMPLEKYKKRMDTLISRAKSCEKAEGFDEIFIPGEIEAITESERRANGIPFTPDVIQGLETEAEKAGIGFDIR
jgi:L-2-hydroxycarboxylate dehydrogenase (NAD+)